MNCVLAFINWFNTNEGFLMALLTTVYVGATIFLVIQSNKANKIAQENLEKLEKLERERVRPHVEIRFDFSLPFLFLIVENTGLTTARNVLFEMEKKPTITIGKLRGQSISFLEKPIASLVPNQQLRTVLGGWEGAEREWKTLEFSGIIHYETTEGEKFNDPFAIELESQKDLLYGGQKGLHQIALALERIAIAAEKKSN